MPTRISLASFTGILACSRNGLLPLLDANEEKALAFAQRVVDAFPQHYADVYRGPSGRKNSD